MWFKLAGADFSKNNLGTMSSISSSYLIDYTGLTGMSGSPSSVSYAGSSAGTSKTASVVVTVTSGYTFKQGSKITASGGKSGTVFTADKDYTGGQTFTFSMAITANTKLSGVAEATGGSSSGGSGGNEPETPVNPPSGGTTTPNTITWELGAINSGGGPNSTDMPKQRIRTAGYLQVESSITIKATGNVEFCPVYYKADKTFISSPNQYQTTDCVVNASEYPLVRLMIRDKTSTSKDLTSSLTALGNSVVITGNFIEIPYDGTSGGGTSGTTGATGIGEGATWQSGAIDSNLGNGSVVMASRIHTGFIPLGNVTVSVSGDAEFCPFLYRADKTYIKPATTPTYQKTTQTWTSADGAYLVLMARNSKNTSATIDPSYGANVNIQTN